MTSLPFSGVSSVRVRAVGLGARLDLRTLETSHRLAAAPIVLPAGAAGCVVLFRYGVAVLFAVQPVEEAALIASLAPFVHQRFSDPQTEELVLRIDADATEAVDNGVVTVKVAEVARVQVVAEVLAKSVVLAHQEAGIAAAFDRIEPVAESLAREGRPSPRGRDLLRHLGTTLLVQHRMVGRAEVDDKPEALWDRPDLERLYSRLSDEYEIRERALALERKLGAVSDTAETLLDLSQQRRSLRVEWYIVVLIVIEILLTLYSMFVRG